MARRKRPDVLLEPTYFREWRKHRKLTLAQVAEAIDIDSTAVSRLERGASPYDQFHLQQLSELYRCTINDLLFVDPRRPKPVDELVEAVRHLSNPEEIKAAMSVVKALLAKR